MNIKISVATMIETCIRYNTNKENYYQDHQDIITINNMYGMVNIVKDTSYPYIIIDEKEFLLIRNYL